MSNNDLTEQKLLKVKIERHLEYLTDMLEKAEEQEEINIETDKYEEVVDETETKKDQLQTIITNHKKEREIEREKEKEFKELEIQKELKTLEMELALKEKQMKNDTEEKLQLEKINLERFRLELDGRKQIEMVAAEVKRAEIESEVAKTKSQGTSTSQQQRVETIRLPKLELKKFGGHILKWQEFWDSFEATIHKNSSLQPIDKFNYLRAQLEKEALKSIAGLELTNANYDVAINMLKERYGNEQLMIDSHYTHLMDLQPAINKIHSLRATYDTIEQHLRSLQALGEDINLRQLISMIRSKNPKLYSLALKSAKT